MLEKVTNENGEQLIEVLEKQNNKLYYSYGFDCGVMNFNPINFESDVVKMPTVSVQLDTDGNPVGNPTREAQWDVSIPIADCIDENGNMNIELLKSRYIDAVLLKQSPKPMEPIF